MAVLYHLTTNRVKGHIAVVKWGDLTKAALARGVSRQREWQIANRAKCRAQHCVTRALKSGRLVKPALCSACGSGGRIEAHHRDYTKPLSVEWFCQSCHRDEHVWERAQVKASVPIQVRVPLADAKILKRAARVRGMKLATYVRHAALAYSELAPDLINFGTDTLKVGVMGR